MPESELDEVTQSAKPMCLFQRGQDRSPCVEPTGRAHCLATLAAPRVCSSMEVQSLKAGSGHDSIVRTCVLFVVMRVRENFGRTDATAPV